MATIAAEFKPMTLDRMIFPLQEYTKAYREQEDALTELEAKASMYERIINQNPDSESAKLYQEYANELKAQSDKLATRGLDITSRKELSNLKKKYFKSINPIEEAYKSKQDLIKKQQDNWMQNKGRVRYSKDARSISIDDFLDGNTPEYTQVNLDDLYKDAATGAAARSARYFKTTEGQAFGNMYKKRTVEQGIPPQIAINELMNSGNYPEFAKLKEDLKSSYNFSDFTNQSDINDFNSTIERGIMDGIVYKKDEDLKANANYESYADAISRKINLGANYGVEIDSNGNIVPVSNEALKQAYDDKQSRGNKGLTEEELLNLLNGINKDGDSSTSATPSEDELKKFREKVKNSNNKEIAEEAYKSLSPEQRKRVNDGELIWDEMSENFEEKVKK